MEESESQPKRVRVRTGRIITIIAIVVIIILAFYIFKNYNPTGAAAAKVNGESISMQELDEQYENIPDIYKEFITKYSLLEQLITEKLLLQEAAKDQITVTTSEIETSIDQLRQSTGQTVEEFELSLEQQGITLDEFKEYYEKQLLVSKLLNKTILEELEVTDSEALEYYQKNLDLYLAEAPQAHAKHILVETKKEAEELIDKLDDGDNFADLAREYSLCPTASKGGDLGFFRREEMVKEFSDAAFELNIGEYTKEPVQTEFGWHVILREPRKIVFEDAKYSIKEALLEQKQKTALDIYLKQLRNNADVEIFIEAEEPVITITEDDYCFTDYGLTKDTVLFYYIDSSKCPECQQMIPIVENLESQGYNIYYADIADKPSLGVLDACFNDKVEGKAPLFICAGSGATKLGKYSESSLKKFLDSCS
ncbi:peptidylprolyl isomerase [Candidatus Woesearchaeota archaeon]|nr:peptidylprolyl isomerase [Candidatus Woesearchaeota archaeon]